MASDITARRVAASGSNSTMRAHYRMSLSSGTILGQYRIGRMLGSGGMGDVYQATHLVLGREVALKTLLPEAAKNDPQRSPLVEEARAASALDHPHIVTVYDVAEVDGVVYIAMEYVDGQTLRELLAHRPLRLKEALQYAMQIASALATAHDAGMLHRDVKPANIMITRKNVVKVVDFGLARLFDLPAARHKADDLPTRTITASWPTGWDGQIAGTVGYMSPEQIRGLRVDARSDIFSFGIVLYEMLTRVRPFTGSSDISITAKILDDDPRPPRDLVPELPDEVDGLVRFCLCKDPDDRARSLHDICHMLETILVSMERRSAELSATSKRGLWWIVGGVTLALVGGSILGTFLTSPTGHAQPRGVLRRITWDGGFSDLPTLSDDGRLLAFASDRAGKTTEIFIRHMSGGEPIPLTNHSAGDTEPSLSPDGGMIAFRSNRQGGGVYVMPSFGGQERLLAPRGNNPRFSPDGKWVTYWIGEAVNYSPSATAFIVPATGGTPKQLQPSFADARYPIWTPDGEHILFQGVDVWKSNTDPNPDWWVAPLDGGAAVRTGVWNSVKRLGFSTIYHPGGWNAHGVVFSARDQAARFLLSIPISTRTWKVQGPPEALTFGTGVDGFPYPTPSGPIAFTSYQYEINIWSRKMDGNGRFTDEQPQKLTAGAAYHTSASMDTAGSRLVFLLGHSPVTNVWMQDLKTGREAAVTVDTAEKCSAAISADGKQVAWSICGPRPETVYLAAITPDLTAPVPEKVCEDCGRVMDWSPSGEALLFLDHSRPSRVELLTLSSKSRTIISSARYSLERAKFSPDGKWVVLRAGQTRGDRAQILAVPLQEGKPAPEESWIAITNGDYWDDNPVLDRAR